MQREANDDPTELSGWRHRGQRVLLALIILMVPMAYPFCAFATVHGTPLDEALSISSDSSSSGITQQFQGSTQRTDVQPAAFQSLTSQVVTISVDQECWMWSENGSSYQNALEARDSSATSSAPGSTVMQPVTQAHTLAFSLPSSGSFLVALPGVQNLSGIAHLPESPPPQSQITI